MDADSSATTSVIAVFERLLGQLLHSKSLSSDDVAKFSVSVREQYIAGMFIALLYMDALSNNFFPTAYPIGYARFLTTSGVARDVLGRHDAEAASLPERVRKLLVAAFQRLSGGVQTLHHPMASNIAIIEDDLDNPRREYSELGVAVGFDYLQPLFGRWARLRPFLERYQRGGRLAPAQAAPL
jgi:hypothetical protein